MRKKINDKPALHEEKLEEIESKSLKKDTVKLSDDVSSLEAERDHVANTITTIDKAFDEIKTEIEAFGKQTDTDKNKTDNEEKDIRKSCKFNNTG